MKYAKGNQSVNSLSYQPFLHIAKQYIYLVLVIFAWYVTAKNQGSKCTDVVTVA